MGTIYTPNYTFDGRQAIYTDDDGKLHREDGPAVHDTINGSVNYLIHGKHHREDGPAILLYISAPEGNVLVKEEYWLNGEKLEPDSIHYKLIKRKYENGKKHRL